MNKVAISAAIGIAVAGAAMAAPYAGVHIPLATMMVAAAALSMGAASAVLTSAVLNKPPKKKSGGIMGESLAASGLILKFPKPAESLALSIRPETRPDFLDVVKYPDKYAKKDIVVWLRGSGESPFNPVLLKQLFTALRPQESFRHLILTGKNDEFVGYIPPGYARLHFSDADADAESLIARYVVNVFADHSNSANLRAIGGASKIDVISDTADVSVAMKRMAGGFQRLVVLHDGYHRKPIGLLDFPALISGTLMGSAPKLFGGAITSDLRL